MSAPTVPIADAPAAGAERAVVTYPVTVRRVIASASLSCRMLPLAASTARLRRVKYAMFDSCSIVTATLPCVIGWFSFAPVRIAAMKLAKCRSVIVSAPTKSEADVAA